jgi:polygalacturonase
MLHKALSWRSWRLFLGGLVVLLDSTGASTSNLLDVTSFGAVGDGLVDDTAAIRSALVAAVEFEFGLGTSTVYFPKDKVFVSAPLNLSSNLILQIDGTLQAITNTTENFSKKWPQLPPLPSYGNSRDSLGQNTLLYYHYEQYQSFLYARDASNIVIQGSGIIDGQGHWWWDAFRNHGLSAGRPNLIQMFNCSHVEITGVTLKDSPFWTLHPVLSQHVHIHHISIRAPLYAPNVDGVDPDSSRHVMIEHNDISCGDDHVAIKAGVCGGKDAAIPCKQNPHFANGDYMTKNVTIRYNILRTGMGIALGSELSGGIEDVHVYQNTIGLCENGHDHDTSCGWGYAIHMKTALTRGGFLRNIDFHTNTIYNTSGFLVLETDYQDKDKRHEIPPDYPVTDVRNISIQGNSGLGFATEVTFGCSKYVVCEDVTVRDNWIVNSSSSNYQCSYVDTYQVDHNTPPGLNACMLRSMNRTTATS